VWLGALKFADMFIIPTASLYSSKGYPLSQISSEIKIILKVRYGRDQKNLFCTARVLYHSLIFFAQFLLYAQVRRMSRSSFRLRWMDRIEFLSPSVQRRGLVRHSDPATDYICMFYIHANINYFRNV
jgi:hypothetical protein